MDYKLYATDCAIFIMRRAKVAIPAVRLPNGEIIQGEPHTILCLRAFEMGYVDGLVGGHVDYRGIFCPVNRTPEDAFGFKVATVEYGIELAESGDWIRRWAAEELINAGRDDAEGLQAYVDRFDSLCKIDITPAIRGRDGKIYAGVELHGELSAQHPEYTNRDREVGWMEVSSGRYLTRKEAREYSVAHAGCSTGPTNLISGEEWFIKLETNEDAIHLGRHWHRHGYGHARNRINVFERKGIHKEYVELLKMARAEYLLEKERGKFKRGIHKQ